MPNYDVVCLGMAVCDILAGPVDASIFDRDTTKVPSIEMRSLRWETTPMAGFYWIP